MADPRTSRTPGGFRVWPLVLGAVVVILAAVLFFMSGPVEEPVPTPGSPAATGTAGTPAGVTGEGAQPGAPAGAEAPVGAPVAEPNPDLAPGTGTDTTRGN